MYLNPLLPYLIALASGVTFGLIARRAQRGYVTWGIGGTIFGLTLSTIVMGIGHAITVPYSDEVIARYYRGGALISILLIAVVVAGVTLSFKRRKMLVVADNPAARQGGQS